MTAHETIDDWIIDDTGLPKQGNKSPGVQRQPGPRFRPGWTKLGRR
jgi:SRSO17 transposase